MKIMQDAFCTCCSDYTRYRRKKDEISRKINTLYRFSSINSINTREFEAFKNANRRKFSIIQMDSTHLHCICGTCKKVNTYEIKLLEDQLRNILWKVFFLIYTSRDDLLYRTTLRLLQGDYSITYRNLERLWYEKERCKHE